MGTSEKVPIFAWIEREEGIPVPSSQSPHASRYIAAWVKGCLQSEARRFQIAGPFCGPGRGIFLDFIRGQS